MIELPQDVEQWTHGKIVDLISEGYDENEILEFKKEINLDSKRLCQTVCAFANTNTGTIIFGIDNDRKKSLHLNDRIIGLDDSDQLKRTIIDKIKNILPNVPIKYINFKKSNIKLPNKKVIVILKILKSDSAPHQYEKLCYKRISDGNEPMSIEEIKNMVLESARDRSALILLEEFGGTILDSLKTCLLYAEHHDLDNIKYWLNTIDINPFEHFMYNQAYLHKPELTRIFVQLIYRFKKYNILQNELIPAQNDNKHIVDWWAKSFQKDIDTLHKIETFLSITYIEPINATYPITLKKFSEKSKKNTKKEKSTNQPPS